MVIRGERGREREEREGEGEGEKRDTQREGGREGGRGRGRRKREGEGESEERERGMVLMLKFIKRPLLKDHRDHHHCKPQEVFIDPTCCGPLSQHAGQRRDTEQRKNTLFIPLQEVDLSNKVADLF